MVIKAPGGIPIAPPTDGRAWIASCHDFLRVTPCHNNPFRSATINLFVAVPLGPMPTHSCIFRMQKKAPYRESSIKRAASVHRSFARDNMTGRRKLLCSFAAAAATGRFVAPAPLRAQGSSTLPFTPSTYLNSRDRAWSSERVIRTAALMVWSGQFFPPSSRGYVEVGAERRRSRRAYDKARSLLVEAGYRGEPIV
jgi:hypothetical protein